MKRVAFAWLLGTTLSASIELTQSTVDRVADINDIILNSAVTALGACLGYGVTNGRARSNLTGRVSREFPPCRTRPTARARTWHWASRA